MGLTEFLIIAGLVFVNGFFVAAEFALVKVRTSQIDQLVEEGNWAAKLVSRALDHLDAYLSASQVGITVASLGLGWAIEKRVVHNVEVWLSNNHMEGSQISLGLFSLSVVSAVPIAAFAFVTFLHVALGEQAPKSLAIRSAKIVALWTVPPLMAIYFIFWPVIWLLNNASNLTLKMLGLGGTDEAEVSHTEEELRHIVAESVAGGHLSRNERIMIENVLNLEEKTARRIMVPRPDIVYLNLSRPVEDNLRVARQAGHTRYPICEDDLNTVIGMIHVKDLFRAGASSNGRPDLRKWARKVPFLPESLKLDDLLVEFQRNKVHLAMLLDEYGSVVGMVSLENVLEELVGPIQDEFDREDPQVTPLGNGVFEVDATCPLDVLADRCAVNVPETEAETAGGLILDLLGRLAKTGDSVLIDAARLVVIRADPTRIRRIRVEPVGELSTRETNGGDSTGS
ncbi:hemolysin family protein [Singulisphaera acidiphila]|uniref:CBS domain-containing protein n=1 Tax=Singulisphaera acidiphila (strain ATCC BAA-1392 / DSM 18658 / VKM B-2454 / MOB10) TaxID=886293 RepID=L0DKD5_SINAD|nr:hemolysin family protein [Singulisphaera acidiphila]AGA29717.1 CBS domain-containing protein [Singulisphaera acidiphila DSM 18658]